MKVKITQPYGWYSNRVGDVLNVTDCGHYYEDTDTGLIICKIDCEIVPPLTVKRFLTDCILLQGDLASLLIGVAFYLMALVFTSIFI